jgi:hypothetical protein
VNLGSLISYTVVAYICQYGIPDLGGEDWGFFVGYLIPAIAMGKVIELTSFLHNSFVVRSCNWCVCSWDS